MRNKGHIAGLCLGMFFLAVACGKTPKGILSEKEMQQVQADMILADALVGVKGNEYANDTSKLALYESVFRKHKINREKYDSSLVWYGKNLDIYMKVYERIIADLGIRIHDLGDIQTVAVSSSKRDSVEIWPRRTYLTISPQSVFSGATFDIKPDIIYPSGSTFVLGMRVWGLRDGMELCPEIRVSAEQRDTVIRVESKIDKDGYYQTILRTMPTRQVRRIYGYIWMNNTDSTYNKIYIDNITLTRYNYGTEFEVLEEEKPLEE
ncbi:MAG: DUF4296 domain-containing protein [Tannerellaceae bacterium]|jgi:hypothetical protein|nr:DUF4296 domain-containing protein [Tannerellaceae bacterium]